MNWMDKLERKIGRYAVPNLMLYIIIMYGAGYVLYLINPAFYAQYLCLNAQAILHDRSGGSLHLSFSLRHTV